MPRKRQSKSTRELFQEADKKRSKTFSQDDLRILGKAASILDIPESQLPNAFQTRKNTAVLSNLVFRPRVPPNDISTELTEQYSTRETTTSTCRLPDWHTYQSPEISQRRTGRSDLGPQNESLASEAGYSDEYEAASFEKQKHGRSSKSDGQDWYGRSVLPQHTSPNKWKKSCQTFFSTLNRCSCHPKKHRSSVNREDKKQSIGTRSTNRCASCKG